MSQQQHRAAQRRAEKRHRREVERRQARTLARKQSPATKERLDGFEDDDDVPSADEEASVHPYLTQRWRERQRLVPRALRRSLRGMHRFWTHAQVGALDEDRLLGEIADRGLVVTRADVLAHIARMPAGGSAWRMSRIHWLPAITERALSAADRDFLGLAAVELWRRLRPDDPPLESLLALVADAEDLRADDPGGYLEGLVRFLAAARDRVDPDAPDEIGGVRLPLGTLRTRMVLVAVRLVEQCPELAGDAAAVAERWLDLVLTDDDVSDRRLVLSTAAHIYEELGRLQDAERTLRGAVALAPDDLVARKLLALHLHEHAAGDRTRLVEALALWDSIRPPSDHPEIDRFVEIRDEIAESLRLHDTPGAGAS
ncbi:hypothetical protein [Nannocystis sp. SCPEA4]|uniref:hypothetical protein n=1 Tax=Nannocystis sp. SCPEA4 TaxID=2996787 RepID=UPI00226D544A|nr:hypothetical protein [Nannocystis sp. SCPEA4]MCY1057397.1 hypothetical protein [Nannocystis sp. SCPEA4]